MLRTIEYPSKSYFPTMGTPESKQTAFYMDKSTGIKYYYVDDTVQWAPQTNTVRFFDNNSVYRNPPTNTPA